jgi:Alw26I/Eco31I/Esp3I family type II restriction m6 adenine DNA methyltransferase
MNDRIRTSTYATEVSTSAKRTDHSAGEWRTQERDRQSTAHDLHRAAAWDLSSQKELWVRVPKNGPVDDLLSLRHSPGIPAIHLSRAAGRLAVWTCIAEMASRRGGKGWDGDSLVEAIAPWQTELAELAGTPKMALARHLPRLRAAGQCLKDLTDEDLARLVGRAYEFAVTTSWLFRTPDKAPERLWHVWRAKQAGCFFTPEFIARHLAAAAVGADSRAILDPAVGAGAFLIEAHNRLTELGVDDAAARLYGVDCDGALTDLSALVVAFLGGEDLAGSLSTRRRFVTGDALLATLRDSPQTTAGAWETWFPGVAELGGFDSILMNPPYLQLKVNQSSLPARPADSPAIEGLRQRAVEQAQRDARVLSDQLRRHPDYSHAHGGVPDLPRFFIERALTLLGPSGRLACIVPSTFLADHRSKGVRRHLLVDHTVREVDLIPEDARLFADVNQPTCLLVAEKGRRPGARLRMRCHITSPMDLRSSRSVSISPRLLHRVDPEQLRIPGCDAEDWALLSLLHKLPAIREQDWIENLRGELDLTLDRAFVSADATRLPLVRGDQIERFTSSLQSTKPRWVRPSFLRESVSHRKLQHIERERVVGRQCSYLKKPRRLSFSVIGPGAVVANSCNYLVPAGAEAGKLCRFLVGALNSSVLEWRFRLTSSTNHVGNYELGALPVPEPTPDLVDGVVELVDTLLAEPADWDTDARLDDVWFDAYGLDSRARARVRAALS